MLLMQPLQQGVLLWVLNCLTDDLIGDSLTKDSYSFVIQIHCQHNFLWTQVFTKPFLVYHLSNPGKGVIYLFLSPERITYVSHHSTQNNSNYRIVFQARLTPIWNLAQSVFYCYLTE